jgi:hypothetical protein
MQETFQVPYNAWSFNFTKEEADVLQATGNLVPENSLELTLPMILIGVGHQFNIKDNFYIEPELNVNINTDGRRNVLLDLNLITKTLSIYAQVLAILNGLPS